MNCAPVLLRISRFYLYRLIQRAYQRIYPSLGTAARVLRAALAVDYPHKVLPAQRGNVDLRVGIHALFKLRDSLRDLAEHLLQHKIDKSDGLLYKIYCHSKICRIWLEYLRRNTILARGSTARAQNAVGIANIRVAIIYHGGMQHGSDH